MIEEMVRWEGPGWYASQQAWGRIRTFALGIVNPQAYDEASVAARARNLGTPEWLDTVPGWCEMGGE